MKFNEPIFMAIGAALFFFVVIVWRQHLIYKMMITSEIDDEQHQAVREILDKQSWSKCYFILWHKLIHQVMIWTEGVRAFSKEVEYKSALIRIWETQRLEFCLKLAFLYPIITLVIIWLFTGQSLVLSLEVLPSDKEPYQRVLFLIWAVIGATLLLWTRRINGWKGFLIVACIVGANITVIGVVAATFSVMIATIAGVFWGMFAVVGIITLITVVPDGLFNTIEIMVYVLVYNVVFGSVLWIVSGYGLNALKIQFIHKPSTLAIAVLSSFAASYISIEIMLGLTFIIISLLTDKVYSRIDRSFLFQAILWFGNISFVLWILSLTTHEASVVLLLLYALLPLAIGMITWLYLETAGSLLQLADVSGNSWFVIIFWIVIDLGIAVGFLFLVIITTITVVALANYVFVAPLINFEQTLNELKVKSWLDSFWGYFIILSALIPIVIHFVLAFTALVLAPFEKWRVVLLNGCETNNTQARKV